MIVPDVNVLINAFSFTAPRHTEAKQWLENAFAQRESVGILDVVATGFIRIMTNPKIFSTPLTSGQALEAIKSILASPNAVLLHPVNASWDIFDEMVQLHKLRGNEIPDAWIASTVIAEEATLISDDQGFARFPNLRWSSVKKD
ncbi:TA system VapC family ribonuclease toxin [Corynebacterium macclintockiae]|uniref:TA system VapC family ribonuclease toxin n=1 Tax=Corynebacterium macclintockiae TaxID=2913501 RepID=UPI003EB8D5D4